MLRVSSAAEDIAQEVLIRLWNKSKNWDQGGPAIHQAFKGIKTATE